MFSLGHCQLPFEELPALLGAGQEWEQSEVKEGKAGHGGLQRRTVARGQNFSRERHPVMGRERSESSAVTCAPLTSERCETLGL